MQSSAGEYWTTKGFHQFVDQAPEWIPKEEYKPTGKDGKNLDKHWQLTYANVLKVAFNHRKMHNIESIEAYITFRSSDQDCTRPYHRSITI
jgi:hypothetical protein